MLSAIIKDPTWALIAFIISLIGALYLYDTKVAHPWGVDDGSAWMGASNHKECSRMITDEDRRLCSELLANVKTQAGGAMPAGREAPRQSGSTCPQAGSSFEKVAG